MAKFSCTGNDIPEVNTWLNLCRKSDADVS